MIFHHMQFVVVVCVKIDGRICGKIKNGWIGEKKIGVVVDIDLLIMVVI